MADDIFVTVQIRIQNCIDTLEVEDWKKEVDDMLKAEGGFCGLSDWPEDYTILSIEKPVAGNPQMP